MCEQCGCHPLAPPAPREEIAHAHDHVHADGTVHSHWHQHSAREGTLDNHRHRHQPDLIFRPVTPRT